MPLFGAGTASALVTADTSGSHQTTPGVPVFGLNHDGVAELIVNRDDGNFRCSGALLSTGMHVLSAAHCFAPENVGVFNTNGTTVKFKLDGPDPSISVSDWHVHPGWNGDLFFGDDIAVLTLSEPAPLSVPRYQIFRDTNLSEIGVSSIKVGFGRSGHGDDGDTKSSGTKRAGLNQYDQLGDDYLVPFRGWTPGVQFVAGSQLMYDFDNGLSANDASGVIFGNADLGYGDDEVFAAPGDSGGPTFVNQNGAFAIAGVHSYNLRITTSPQPDVDGTRNKTFGEFDVDARVANYVDFIISVLANDAIPGDANLDGEVSVGDLAILATNFGTSPGPGSWELGDFNFDGNVTIADLSLLSSNFGATVFDSTLAGLSVESAAFALSESGSVPEPNALSLLALGAALTALRSRRPAAATSAS